MLLDAYTEVMYGGAAGGGKSDALLMAALQYVDVPDYNALLLRRTYSDLKLPGALLDRADGWLRGKARWRASNVEWQFPSGATLTFGHLQNEADKYRYQGADFQFIGFDELTQFSITQYLYLFSRLRRGTGMAVPLRMRSASNPGGIGHDWVRTQFIPQVDEHGKAHFPVNALTGQRRIFVPARLADNPHLDQESYLRSLSHLDPVTRARLLHGDWDVREGGMFKRADFQEIEVAPPRESLIRQVRRWDLAATAATGTNDPDWTVGGKMAIDREGRFYILDIIRIRSDAQDVERTVRSVAATDGIEVPINIEQEPGAAGKSLVNYYIRNVLQGFAVRGVPSTGSKEVRAAPLSSQTKAGNVFVVRGPWLADMYLEFEGFTGAGDEGHDDQVDALSGAFHDLVQGGLKARSTSALPSTLPTITRHGDLTLVGTKYVDLPPRKR